MLQLNRFRNYRSIKGNVSYCEKEPKHLIFT